MVPARRVCGPRKAFLIAVVLAFTTANCHGPVHVPPDTNAPIVATLPLPSIGIADRAQDFADLFYSVLTSETTFFREWSCCDHYLRLPGHPGGELPPLRTGYRVLIVSGMFSQCLKTVTAFSDASAHLTSVHGLSVSYLEVPALGSTAENGTRIAGYLDKEYENDGRPFVIVGYSKGAPDSQDALTRLSHPRAAVALVTVSGAIGGTRLIEILPKQFGLWFKKLHLTGLGCEAGDAKAFIDLTPARRHAFLQTHPNALVPTYCVTAVSTRENTSRILLPTFDYLSVFDSDQDSQMIVSDMIAPHSTFLGVANGDHWAVAMPFEDRHDPLMNALVDKNHFPRTILLEAVLRFVERDLPEAGK
jgi:hypothetical protein